MQKSSLLMYGAHVFANSIRQHYLRLGGTGRPLVIVPGITSPAYTWQFVAERFAAFFDTYIVDIRGRGLSQSGDDLNYGVDACAEDLRALLAELQLKDAVVVGHSMGARIALRALAKGIPESGSVILVDPPVSGPNRRRYPAALDWYVDSIAQAHQGMTAEDMRAYCPTWSDEQLQLRAQWLHTCSTKAIVESYQWFHSDDMFPDFQKIQDTDVCLMVAERGDVIRAEDINEAKALYPKLAVTTVQDAGHMIPWDNYDGFFEAISSFLKIKI